MASILLVEDVPAVLLSLRIVLEGSGHRITGVSDAGAALAMLARMPFDLVITDIWMPGRNGTELIRDARMRWPRIRFLAITGGDPNSRSAGGEVKRDDYGADAVLFKPFEKRELLAAVARLLETAAA